MTFFRTLTTTFLLGTLWSCSMNVEDKQEEKSLTSPLVLDSLSISSVQDIYDDASGISRPGEKAFVVKACFKETVLLEKIRSHEVNISGRTYTTDSNGCVFWNEKVAMGSSLEDRYVRFSKDVSFAGRFSGNLKVEYAFNLFNNNFVNLQHTQIPEDRFVATGKNEHRVDFDMTDLTIYFGGYDTAHDDSRSNKRVISKWKGCFKYKVDMSSLSNQIIEMQVIDENGEVVQEVVNKTDLKGCLRSNIYTEYDQFQPVKWIPRKLVVKSVSGPLKGQVLEREIFINPWVNGRNHGWDSRSGEPPSNPVEEKAKLFIDSVRYTFLGNKEDGYKVNKYLDLAVTKTYLVELRPKIDRGHSFSSNRMIEDIYTGRFKLKVGILSSKNQITEINAENAAQYEFVTGTEKEVEVVNNKIITSIELPFKFEDLIESSARTVAVIKLAPIDEETNLQPIVVSGHFLASSHQISVGLRPHNNSLEVESELNIGDLILEQKLDHIAGEDDPSLGLDSNWKGDTKELFNALHKESFDNKTDLLPLNAGVLSKSELSSLLNNQQKPAVLKKLCKGIYPKKTIPGIIFDSYNHPAEYYDCLKTPEKHIRLDYHKHIHSILGRAQKIYTSTDRINVGTGFLVYDGESRRVSRGRRVSFGGSLSAKLDIPFLSFLSAGLGFNADISKMWTRDEQSGTTSRAQFSRSRNLFVDELKLGFEAKLTTCVKIEGKPIKEDVGFWRNTAEPRVTQSKLRFRVCSNEDTTEWVEESWYYVGEQKPSHSVLRDPWSVSENYLGKIIRGKKNYDAFYNLMTDDTKVIFLQKIETLQGNDSYLQQFYKPKDRVLLKDMAIPGTITL